MGRWRQRRFSALCGSICWPDQPWVWFPAELVRPSGLNITGICFSFIFFNWIWGMLVPPLFYFGRTEQIPFRQLVNSSAVKYPGPLWSNDLKIESDLPFQPGTGRVYGSVPLEDLWSYRTGKNRFELSEPDESRTRAGYQKPTGYYFRMLDLFCINLSPTHGSHELHLVRVASLPCSLIERPHRVPVASFPIAAVVFMLVKKATVAMRNENEVEKTAGNTFAFDEEKWYWIMWVRVCDRWIWEGIHLMV